MNDFRINNFEHIGFDFDGVLADSIQAHATARMHAYISVGTDWEDERFSNIDPSIHEQAHRHGSNARTINAWILHKAGIIDENDPYCLAVDKIVEVKDEVYHGIVQSGVSPIEGMVHFVRKTAVRRPGRMSIVSTSRQFEVMPFLSRNKIDRLFYDRLVLGGDPDVLPSQEKPHPRAYEVAIERSKLSSPEKLLVIEDSEQGIASAKQAGAVVIAIATTHSYDELYKIGVNKPDIIVEDAKELESILEI